MDTEWTGWKDMGRIRLAWDRDKLQALLSAMYHCALC